VEGLGFGGGEGPCQAELLEPADQSVGEAREGEPRPVGGEIGEGEPLRARVSEAADVVFDVGVGARMCTSRSTASPSASASM